MDEPIKNGNGTDQAVIDIDIRGSQESKDTTAAAGSDPGIKRRKERSTRTAAAAGNTKAKPGNTASEVFEIPVLEPKKKRSGTKSDQELSDNIKMILEMSFNFAAIRAGEHWQISPDEAALIADPASRILKRLGVNKTASKYMDYITLTTGAAMIIIPRVIISKSKNKENHTENVKAVKNEISKNDTSDRGNNKPDRETSAGNSNVKTATESVFDEYQ